MITTYPQAVQYLYDNLPMFQRVGASAYKHDLTNTIRLCEALGNPQHKFKSIHVAGTNGKGSTSHMLASVLQSAGYKTGLYTSPHLKDFTERIRVNGDAVSQSFVIEFVNRIIQVIEEIKPSFFEITVAMAFEYFVQQKVDIAVIEVGLGGRLDSTNVITPLVSVITNIGWDHKDLLGNTLQQIAFEKAGIIKEYVPVVISEYQENVKDVFISKSNASKAAIKFASDDYKAVLQDGVYRIWRKNQLIFDGIQIPLVGNYQQKNLPGVLATIDVLKSLGMKVPDKAVLHGLENVIIQTKLKGRWQRLGEQPLIICDTGHNINGLSEIVRQINEVKYEKLHMVIGVVKDKDINDMLAILPKHASYYFCQAKIPRAMEASVLLEKAKEHELKGVAIADVNAAIDAAKNNASTSDFIFIGGSTFVVAEINHL